MMSSALHIYIRFLESRHCCCIPDTGGAVFTPGQDFQIVSAPYSAQHTTLLSSRVKREQQGVAWHVPQHQCAFTRPCDQLLTTVAEGCTDWLYSTMIKFADQVTCFGIPCPHGEVF